MIKNGKWLGSYSIWQNKQFAELFAKHKNYQLLELEGVLVYVSSKPGIGKVSAYVYDPAEEKLLNAVFIEKLKDYLKLHHIPRAFIYSSQGMILPLSEVKSGGTYVIDLTLPEEKLFSTLQSRCRNAIRKGQKSGLLVCEARGEKDFDQWWEIYNKTMAYKHVNKQEKNLIFTLYKKGLGRLFIVLFNGQIIAGAFLLFDQYPLYYLGGMDRRFSSLSPNNYLQWEIILRMKKEKYLCYDLGGVSPDGRLHGPSYFKESFGGKFVKSRHYMVYNRGFIKLMFLRVYEGLLWIQAKLFAFKGRRQ